MEKPKPKSLLEQRFIAPVIDRLFGGYPDLAYADALHADALPPNIRVFEFFFLAGKWLHVPLAQQHYISANCTHASSYLLARGLNAVMQLVAKRIVDGETRYSLSCNTDTSLVARWSARRWRGAGRDNLISVSFRRFAGTTIGKLRGYLFLFTGLRFSMNAAMPSERSSSAKVA